MYIMHVACNCTILNVARFAWALSFESTLSSRMSWTMCMNTQHLWLIPLNPVPTPAPLSADKFKPKELELEIRPRGFIVKYRMMPRSQFPHKILSHFSFQFYLHKLHNTISQIADLLSRRVRSLNFYYSFTINLHRGFFKSTAEKIKQIIIKRATARRKST